MKRKAYNIVKRFFDLSASLIMLIVLFPALIIISLIILVDDGAPVLFRQKRMGLYQKPFTIYKFRTMYKSAPIDVATKDLSDPLSHITRIGRFLRKTSIDEFPQLINVLIGEMSFVGPRPVVLNETDLIDLRSRMGLYNIRPGITGWAQINGRDYVPNFEKARMDKYYLDNQSVWLDIKIILKTLVVVFCGNGIHEGEFTDRHKIASNMKNEADNCVMNAK